MQLDATWFSLSAAEASMCFGRDGRRFVEISDRYGFYISRKDDTLWLLSAELLMSGTGVGRKPSPRQIAIKLDEIEFLNDRRNADTLLPGTTLRLPLPGVLA